MPENLPQKEKLVSIYTGIMAIILQKNAEIWGPVRVKSFMEVAVSRVSERYDFIPILESSRERPATIQLKRQLQNVPEEKIKSAYQELTTEFFDVMSAFSW